MEDKLKAKRNNSISYNILTLGRFDVLKDGDSILLGNSGAKKIWELYNFFLTNRGHEYSAEDVMDLLWIDENYNDSSSTLRRQMHRLKKILGEEKLEKSERTIIYSHSYYYWNVNNNNFKIDIDEFERLINKGNSFKKTYPLNSIEFYKEAVKLYKGDYLNEYNDKHWVFTVRNYYKRLFINTVLNLSKIYEEIGSYEEVIDLCYKAIQIDIYEEKFHINYLKALLVRGRRKEALQHYEYITSFYYREMGIKPSLQFKDIYKKLLKNNISIKSENNLDEVFDNKEDYEHAFYCEQEIFKSIFELSKRKNQRLDETFTIAILTILSDRESDKIKFDLKMKNIKDHLLCSLRKGDVFTQWNNDQFVIMFSGIDEKLTHKVLSRVINIEKKDYSILIKEIANFDSNFDSEIVL